MNYGFRIVYHKDIKWCKKLESFMLNRINHFCSKESYKCRTDSKAFYRRNLFGIGLNEDFETSSSKPIIYTFKRLTRSKRIFGIIPISKVERKDGKPLELNICMCAVHRGGQKVKLKKKYTNQDFNIIFETGKISG